MDKDSSVAPADATPMDDKAAFDEKRTRFLPRKGDLPLLLTYDSMRLFARRINLRESRFSRLVLYAWKGIVGPHFSKSFVNGKKQAIKENVHKSGVPYKKINKYRLPPQSLSFGLHFFNLHLLQGLLLA